MNLSFTTLTKINKKIFICLAFFMIFMSFSPKAFPQGLNGTLVITNPSPYVSEWETNASIAILTIIDSKRTMDVEVRVRLNKDGQLVSSVLSGDITQIKGPDAVGRPPVTTIFKSNQIARWSQLKFTGGKINNPISYLLHSAGISETATGSINFILLLDLYFDFNSLR